MGVFDSLLEEHGGDLKQLVGKFESSGLGDKVKSWVGTGPNDRRGRRRQAGAWPEGGRARRQVGIGEDQAAEELAQTLPDAVDKATPDGILPGTGDAQAVGAQQAV